MAWELWITKRFFCLQFLTLKQNRWFLKNFTTIKLKMPILPPSFIAWIFLNVACNTRTLNLSTSLWKTVARVSKVIKFHSVISENVFGDYLRHKRLMSFNKIFSLRLHYDSYDITQAVKAQRTQNGKKEMRRKVWKRRNNKTMASKRTTKRRNS